MGIAGSSRPRGSRGGGEGSSKACFLPQGRQFTLCPPPQVMQCLILGPARGLLSLPGPELNQIAFIVQSLVANLLSALRGSGGGIWEHDLGLDPGGTSSLLGGRKRNVVEVKQLSATNCARTGVLPIVCLGGGSVSNPKSRWSVRTAGQSRGP